MTHSTTDIWDYPDTDAVHAPTRAHEFVVWTSLAGLDPFWRSFEAFDGRTDELREIARDALVPYQEGRTAAPVEDAFLDAVAAGPGAKVRTGIEGLWRTASAREIVPGFSEWEGWFSMRQHEPEIVGVEPVQAENLMKAFRSEVVRLARERREMLRGHLTDRPLPEWDLAIHAYYGYNYYHLDSTDRSVVLTGLGQFDRAVLFDAFVRAHVLTLPEGAQAALHTALVRDWQEILAEDAPAGLEHVLGSDDPAAEAARLPVARDALP